MHEPKKLKELIKLMVDNDLTELDLQDEGQRITLKRAVPGQVTSMPVAAPAPTSAPQPAAEPADKPDETDGLVPVTSPMVGTYYGSPSPDAPPFINVGDRVDEETVVCIVEAMKVFNEIKAQTSGTVEKIVAENGLAVEFGQPLILIKPA